MNEPYVMRKKERTNIPKTIVIFLPTLSKKQPATIRYKTVAMEKTIIFKYRVNLATKSPKIKLNTKKLVEYLKKCFSKIIFL